MTLEEKKPSVKRLMEADPIGTMKTFELIRKYYESNNQWNDGLDDYHLYKLCKSIILDKKLEGLLKDK
jgi:hypothetical protein